MEQKLLLLQLSLVLMVMFAGVHTIYAQDSVTRIYTDYNPTTKKYDPSETGGLWDNQTYTSDADRPRNQHHLLAFDWKGTTYSTGIDDTKLINNGLTFTAAKFQALPVNNFVPDGTSVYLQLGEYWDGVSDGITGPYNTDVLPPPFSAPQGIGTVLTHGLQGLDLGSAITNIPESTPLTFNFGAIVSPAVIGDGIPDIIITQMAQPDNKYDDIWFEDGNGNQVGDKLSINFQGTPHLGKWFADFYVPQTGYITAASWINASRDIRILAFEASDFGLTTTNYTDALVLRYHLKGSSDVAFIAYNTEFVSLTSASDDVGIIPKSTPITLDILANDDPDHKDNMESFTVPDTTENGGMVTQNADGTVTYTPAIDFAGTDTFTYEICANGSCATAIVTILVYPDDYEICIGKDIILSAPTLPGNYDYSWTLPDNSTTAPQNTSSGNISLSLTNVTADDGGVYELETTNTADGIPYTYHLYLEVRSCRMITNPMIYQKVKRRE